MPRKSLRDLLNNHAAYNAVNWRDHEARARVIASDPALLKKRLFNGQECLLYGYRELFTSARFDFAGKRLVTRDGVYALQWLARIRPDLPDSYENQQTNIGSCVLVKYNRWQPHSAVMLIDRKTGAESFGQIEHVTVYATLGYDQLMIASGDKYTPYKVASAGITTDSRFLIVPLE